MPEFSRLVFDDKKERTMTVCHVLVAAPCPLGARSAVILLIAHGVPLEDYCHWPSFSLGSSGLLQPAIRHKLLNFIRAVKASLLYRCTMVFLATSSQVAIWPTRQKISGQLAGFCRSSQAAQLLGISVASLVPGFSVFSLTFGYLSTL